MTALHTAILTALRASNCALTAREIRSAIPGWVHIRDVQAALHRLDDAGSVMMRNGFYTLSKREAKA